MPNKTIYVSDADLALYQRAQEIAGGNLSAAISQALRRLVDAEDARSEGFEEITVRVGPGKGRRQRFFGVLLVEWSRTTRGGREDDFHVYLSRTGKLVVHEERSAEWVHKGGADGKATGLRKHFSSEQMRGSTAASATLTVYDSLDDLSGQVPDELFDLVSASADLPVVEDLDI